LFTWPLPWVGQNHDCLRIGPTMMTFSALCISASAANMGWPS